MFKKRTLIALFLTIICLYLTNKLWISFEPMPFDFKLKGNGVYGIQIFLNKKDSDDFKKFKTEYKEFNLKQTSDISFNVKRSKHPKRLKLSFTNFMEKSPIILENPQFRHGKYKLNLENFVSNGAYLKVKNNELYINPKTEKFELLYDKPLNITCEIKFEFLIFITIMILSYFLFYALSNYLAEFKDLENQSPLEIFFMTIFFILLFIPMINIDTSDIALKEKRTLTKYEPIFMQDGKLNLNYGKMFNNWYNDRFFTREQLIRLYENKYLLSLNWKTKDVIKGKNGWLFLNWKESVESYTNENLFSEPELKKIDLYLENINKYCKKHNKQFYFIISPDKSKIYGEFYTDSIKQKKKLSKSQQLINYINLHSKVKTIYPKNRLLKEKTDKILYYKDDTHWNPLGAYWAYKEIIKDINKNNNNLYDYDFKNQYIEHKFKGDLKYMLPEILKEKEEYIYQIPKNNNLKHTCKVTKNITDIQNCFNKTQTKNLLMFRDSFAIDLIPYMSESFRNSKYIWQRNVVPSMMNNADIIILEVVERQLDELINLNSEVK